MAKPVLHISKGSGRLCDLPYNGSNWPEKYMDDKVARKLDICSDCKDKYIKINSQELFEQLENRLRGHKKKGLENCDCGCHPDKGMKITKSINKQRDKQKVMTLRMYLDSY